MATHLAAVALAKGEPFVVQTRPTPRPGPDELLIEVKVVALNPADRLMRDQGLLISTYPTVIGFDIAGLVLEVGENVPVDATADDDDDGVAGLRRPLFRPGVTRVAAYAASFWRSFGSDYGAFQERCLVPWQHAAPLPDEGISWNQAATLPVAVQVPLSAWDAMGLPRVGEATASSFSSFSSSSVSAAAAASVGPDANEEARDDKRHKREALLVWGASSSVGTMGVQTARLLRGDDESAVAAVYAVCGAANRTYVGSVLGADRVFDYKDSRVVEAIVSAAGEDGLTIRHCFLATGQLAPCQAVLKAFIADDQGRGGGRRKAMIASAPVVPPDAEEVEGTETIFVMPSMDEGERMAQFRYWMGTWMRQKLAGGAIRPSPDPRVVGKGLEAINTGLDVLARGVSCAKLVVEVVE
ncbi:Putative GroES-like superfamily, polyketide synthase, enoylreductase domain, trans-enoyl reductase [Colletotrichum destructivum]|uniref:GroES-like superfamily, polyketide synthase, enoylreductase domain, trans-enoyl reductase n=1 Tax=Colletotrichum destructivum TaxID=34406 RepID=A0AAX4HW58_9PEZI|nr:Putative GroES-like superfamily, polyketide synthase, enoylreductase domain, trans-enoyl reductase [Colletotrichum destructivum]